MEELSEKERKNKRIGWMTSVGVQLVLLLLFYFLVAWREPFPPIPEYGIELGFTSSAGASAAASRPTTSQEESQEVIEESQNVEETVEEEVVQETEPIEAQEEIEAVTQEVEDVAVTEELPDNPVPTEEEVVEEEPEEQVDQRAVMPPASSDTDGTNDQPSEGEEENQEVDERALYGNQGSNASASDGASLSLAGWIWDFEPRPDDTSDQSGEITYRIVVDGDGLLVKLELVTSSVSPSVERKYRAAVQRLTFSKTGDYQSAPLSSGTVTFIIKSK